MKKGLAFLIVFFALAAFSTTSFSIEETEETEFAYGTVASVDLSAGTVVIKEQDYDTDIKRDVTYYFSPDTDFENANSINEIAVGNDVDISYLTKDDGKKIIKFISVYRPELEEEEE